MKNRYVSTIGFKSNLQPIVEQSNIDDHKFLAHIHDPFCLATLKKDDRYHFTKLQESEFRQTSLHCVHAYPDDYPFGTILSHKEKEVVCKCLKTDCPFFPDCRPDFKQEELNIFQENKYAATEISDFLSQIDKPEESPSNESNSKAFLEVFKAYIQDEEKEDQQNIETINRNEKEYSKKASYLISTKEELYRPNKIADADLSSPFQYSQKLDIGSAQHVKPNEIDLSQENQSAVTKSENFSLLIKKSNTNPPDGGDSATVSGLLNKKHDRNGMEIWKNNKPDHKIEIEHIKDVNPNNKEKKDRGNALSDMDFSSFIPVAQKVIIEASPKEKIIVNAGPGTGKTYTLIERIKFLLSTQQIDPENILVLCFSKAAVKVIQDRFENVTSEEDVPYGWNQVDIRTFDSFATYLISWAVKNKPESLPVNYCISGEDYEQRISTAVDILNNTANLFPGYQQIVVDEVQDLVGKRAELVLAMLKSIPEDCGFTLLGDSCQSLYDYLSQNDSEVMSSTEFYSALFHEYRNSKLYSLTENHRQGQNLLSLTIPYRKAIISGNISECEKEAEKLREQIQYTSSDLIHFTHEDEKEYIRQGTLGILTRTNAQALQISAWLRNGNINHIIQRPSENHYLAEWVFNVLSNTESDMIDKIEFTNIFRGIYSHLEENVNNYWLALLSGETDSSKTHHLISNILLGILRNGRNALLFEEPREEFAKITVSNIHRAKGKEFDSVIVLKDMIDEMADIDNQDLLENKVCYVALTRAKKSVEKTKISDQYIYVSKDDDRRCFKAAFRYRGKGLSHFEVGHNGDIDECSFAGSSETQRYIRENVTVGDRMKLIKCKSEINSNVVYRIVPEDNEKVTLGYTTCFFTESMIKALQRIYNNYHSDLSKYLPNIFNDIYVDHKITCIAEGPKLPGSIQFGNVQMWAGVSISGFAQREQDRY